MIYASRRMEVPEFFGDSVLSDFGEAVRGDEKRNHQAQPRFYRVSFILPIILRL
jgi:serine/threonine-protein kinase SRPK3